MKKTKYILFNILVFTFLFIFNEVNAVEELPDNGAKISSSQIIQTKTGTGPFDDNDEPGNDSSEDNNIVRSFDQVTWTIENTMVLNNSDATGYTGGKIYFEATLPDVFTSETAKWDLDSMAWVENAQVSNDGLTLSGYYQMGTENITIPGKQTLVFVTKIEGAANNTEFQPTIKLWLNGNTDDNIQTVIPKKNIVSATPRYNIKLVNNSYWNQRVDVDFGEGSEVGRMYGYGFVIQLYNTSPSKALKGLEFPKGDITFDIKLKMERSDVGSKEVEDITKNSDLKLWNYQVNNSSNYGYIPNRSMVFSGIVHSRFNYNIPYGKATSENMEKYGNRVYDSGNFEMTQINEDTIRVTVRDYKFNGMFPVCDAESTKEHSTIYTENIGCFVSDYFQIFVPDNDATTIANSNYYLTVENTDFKATSISGTDVSTQEKTTDDKVRLTHVRFRNGSYSQYTYIYNKEGNAYLSTDWRYGDATASIGDIFTLNSSSEIGRTNEDDVYEIDKLVKFDGEAFEPVAVNGKYYFLNSFNTMTFNNYFVTKKDGTNWISQDEMNKAVIEDLVIYNSIEDIPDGYLCVGMYYESKDGFLDLPYSTPSRRIHTYLRIKENAVIGQTYGFTQTNKYWLEDLDRTKYSQTIVNGYDTYPKPVYSSSGLNYIKTEYDENGVQISGTHSGAHVYGNSLLIIGAKQGIQQSTFDTSNQPKVNFDLGRNENIVRYKIEPNLYQDNQNKSEISNVTIKITDTLPLGLSYVAGSSNYGEPQITKNGDGTTTLIFYINNCVTDKKIDELYFSASIDEDTANGVQYTNKAVISTDDERVGNTPIAKRTSTSTIQIINLSSHRLYKSVETPVIEKNGEIHYRVSYKNNTDGTIPEFQMLDILPYNGDNRGTEYTGSYTLDRLVVTQTNGNGEEVSNENLKILYTSDESVRGKISSKDENLGEGWTEAKAETIKQKVVAYVVKGEIGAQSSVTVDIYVKTNGNKGLDKYVNSATAQVYKDTEEMVTSNAVSQVVERKIEGIAWEDTNSNGVKDEGEELLKNVEVSLTNDQGEEVTDVNGNKVSSVRTNEEGYYKFENLPRGNYYIRVSIPSSKYELTEKEVGTNSEINSKFDVEERETDEITKLNSIDLPELTVSNVNAGFVKKETKVKVLHVLEGTDVSSPDSVTEVLYPTEEITGRVDDNYTTQNRLEEINANSKVQYDLVTDEVLNKTGQMTVDIIYVVYEYRKAPGIIKIEHKDIDTKEDLIEQETRNGYVGEEYTTENKLEEINIAYDNKYELVSEPENKNGEYKREEQIVTYYYQKKLGEVEVNYLEVGTEKVLAKQEITQDKVDNKYITVNKLDEINKEYENKYEFVNTTGAQTEGIYKLEKQVVNYYYQKKQAKVKVLHVLEGTDVSRPDSVTEVLYPTEEITGRVDDNYTTQNRLEEINANSKVQYDLVTDEVEGKAGQMTVDTIYVVYEYRKAPGIIKIEHKDIDTKEDLIEQEIKNGYVGEEYTTENKLDEINIAYDNKYELVSEPENKNGEYKREEQIVTYYYQKKLGEVEVNYLEVGTEKILAKQEITQDKVDNKYTTVNKLDEINKEYENKYEFVNTTGAQTEGIYKLEKQVVNYYYQKKATRVKVLHVLEGTDVSSPENVTDVLYPTEEIIGRVDDNYTTQNRLEEINGNSKVQYDLVTDEVLNKTGQMTVDTIYVVYEYRKAPGTIKIEHKDINTGEDLIEVETKNGVVGEEYTTTNKLDEINEKYDDKYELVSEPGNKDGEYKREEQTITYYYQKKATNVIVKYVDIDTEEELIEGEEIIGRIDDEYKTEDKIEEINEKQTNKYVLVKTTENIEGKMEKETIEVVYYYKKVEAQVIVKHVDEETEEEIAEREYIGGYVGDRYTTREKEIEGYEVVIERIPKNKEGNMEEEVIEVIYYYKKIPKVENIDTGDIAVYAVASVAVICVIGIVYVIIKNRKKNK